MIRNKFRRREVRSANYDFDRMWEKHKLKFLADNNLMPDNPIYPISDIISYFGENDAIKMINKYFKDGEYDFHWLDPERDWDYFQIDRHDNRIVGLFDEYVANPKNGIAFQISDFEDWLVEEGYI